ncbi:MAG: acyl-homoserine-lactone synthase [Candidatus Obscuribacterales bacterium]|nr:acyl-homoserine-lactone synthase [Candidatus Obscuribacterales bacterium]
MNQTIEKKSEKPKLASAETAKKQSLVSTLSKSYVVWALIALLSVDAFCRIFWNDLKLDHYASANRSMVWWAVDDFRKQEKTPELVLIGSSLLMHVLHGGDAEYFKLPQNEVYHHKAAMLEDLLSKESGVKVNSFAFALAGQMASDAYALSSTVLKGEHKPKVLIYAIAPRDLIDNTLGSPASTEIFRFMNHLGGARDVAWQARSGLWEKVEYALESISGLYAHRNYFVYLQQRYTKSLLHAFGYKINDEVHTPFALRRLALLDMPEDIGSNERIALPNLKATYTDNSDEYRRRYQPFKEKDFRMQLSYLDKLMAYCNQEGIELILVNMPLTQDNLQLMQAGSYELYKSEVGKLASKYKSRFIDLQDSKRFDKSLYCDTAHMNGAGGVQFFTALSKKLTDGSSLALGKNGTWQ